MPEYLTPGVYIEEFEIGARPIEGVSTSTAGFLGETERGPTKPRLITGWLDYQRRFGGYFGADKYLPYAVEGFFQNGGQRCYVGRIVKSGDLAAINAQFYLKGADQTNALKAEANGEGLWGDRIYLFVAPGTDSGFKLNIYYGKELVEQIDNISISESSPDYFGKKVNDTSNFIKLSMEPGDSGSPQFGHKAIAQGGTSSSITLASTASSTTDAYKGMYVKIIDGKGKDQINKIIGYAGNTKVATVEKAWTTNPDDTSKYSLYNKLDGGTDLLGGIGTAQNGSLTDITLPPAASTTDDIYKNMQIEITGGTGKGQIRKIDDYNGASKIATVNSPWATAPDSTSTYRISPSMNLDDYSRTDSDMPGKRKGLTGFTDIDEISIVYSPNAQVVGGLVDALITHCELLKDRFAIIDSAQGSEDVDSSALKPRDSRETQYAALYYPWIKIFDSASGQLRLLPPGGHIGGIYARSDTERGVHKAPANETVRGAADLEFPITKAAQGILNPRGVNVIRFFPGRGNLVWGARTLSSNSLWKYINVRRLFIYIEESIDEGTQWVVFEPNNEKLWARVRATITQFLTRVWRDGALMGTKVEEAFFVKCDRTTMTQDDIDNGRLICVIGIAPVKPAEFVIFRIAQWAGGSSTTE